MKITKALILVFSLCITQNVSAQAAETKPNVLFIFADDQAFDTLRSLGNHEIETPNLDRLVRRSTYFTHAYNQGGWSGAICVASRTMLVTGRFLWKANAVYRTSDQERAAGRFWPVYMRNAGYDTYFSGKWHIRADATKAFDFVTHVRPGMPNQRPEGYNRPIEGQTDVWKPWDTRFGGYWKGGKHWSEVLGDDAIGFLKQAAGREKPFFMYLAFNAPHDPRQSPQEYVDRYPLDKISVPESFIPLYPNKEKIGLGTNQRDERLAPFPRTEYSVKVNRQEYYAIITHMDAQIGRILDALEKTGKADNTYIIFSADHGLSVGRHGLMGKQNMFDHSVRVPLMVSGPGIPKNKKLHGRVYLQDIMPTTLEIAGVQKPAHVQFNTLFPMIRGERKQNYNAVYGGYLMVQRMVTENDQKLILYPTIKKILLYNLKKDPKELHNLAGNPEFKPTIQRLFATLLRLQKETGDPLDLKAAYPNL